MSIAVIGIGGAGGNIANEASKLNIPCGAINFSQRDLDSLDEVKYKLKIMGSEGVGHNRDIAIELIKEHYPMVVKFIKEHFDNPEIDIIFVSFSTGGGSGAGSSPILIDILSYEMPNKTFVAMPILPDELEPIISQINSYKTMDELSRLDVCVLPIDNQEVKNNYGAIGKNRIFHTTNNTSISLLHKILMYTGKFSKNGNFDRKDLNTVFSQRGIGCISEADIATLPKSNITSKGISESIFQSWEKSIFSPIEYERVAKCAFIFDGQESLIEYIDYELIFANFSHGAPIDLFEGYYHENNGKIITILTGLPWCNTRMESMDRIIENGKSKVEIVINSMENSQFNGKSFD